MENIKIDKYDGGYIILYKNFYTCKMSNPTIWDLSMEICQIYTTEEFAKNDIRSLKRYITQKYNGDFEKWEEKQQKNLIIPEYCPNCNAEVHINYKGGNCPYCNNFLKPCSLCNMNDVICSKCKFDNEEA